MSRNWAWLSFIYDFLYVKIVVLTAIVVCTFVYACMYGCVYVCLCVFVRLNANELMGLGEHCAYIHSNWCFRLQWNCVFRLREKGACRKYDGLAVVRQQQQHTITFAFAFTWTHVRAQEDPSHSAHKTCTCKWHCIGMHVCMYVCMKYHSQ